MRGMLSSLLIGVVLISVAACGQDLVDDQSTSPALVDELDVSAINERFAEGFPERADVDAAITRATELFNSGDCAAALPALGEAADLANRLANLISVGLEPFYGASYDDTRSFTGVNQLVGFENMSNQYKRQRNELIVYEAECLLQTGDREGGVARLYRALELIDIDDGALWTRAREKLYAEIGLN